MKKKVLSVVLTLAMVVTMIPAMCITASAATTQGWTQIGTCEYQITGTAQNKTLTIRPEGNGTSGTLPDNYTSYSSWPWYNSGDYYYITKVVIEKGVKAGNSTAYMFYYFNNLDIITGLENFDTSNVTNMSNMFCNCFVLNSLDLSNFDTSNVTNMAGMFNDCYKLKTLDLSNFDTSNVTNMSYMFAWNYVLNSLDLSNFDTSNVTDMAYMFGSCNRLSTLDVSSFDTSNVTGMNNMFYNCRGLHLLDLSNFDTSNVTNMSYLFQYCENLRSLDLSNFDTTNVTNMAGMFYSCYKLKTIDISNFDTSKVTDMSEMFCSCVELKTMYASDKFDVNKVSSSEDMFRSCNSLVGGEGTKYDASKIDKTYARIDGGTKNPGYFTKLTTFKKLYVNLTNNINRVKIFIKKYYDMFNKIFFNGKIDLSWLFS